MKQEQPIVKPKDYLFNTWVKGTEIIKTEKGDVTVLELLTDFKSHLLQNVEHNKEAYHEKQCDIHIVSYCKKRNANADRLVTLLRLSEPQQLVAFFIVTNNELCMMRNLIKTH